MRGIDLEVAAGEIFAFLGPNGAGKTTTVEILEGYRGRTGGEVTVLGADPARVDREWRERIGIVLQESKMHPELTVRESLELFAGYYRSPRGVAGTIDLTGLSEKAEDRVGRLSGGQQRRLDVALALIGDPELLFLDEPTTGFDPSARRRAWEVVASLRDLGKTVFLTTHYMEEAQALADRVAIIARRPDRGAGLAGRAGRSRRTPPPESASGCRPASPAPTCRRSSAAAVGNGEVRLQADDPVPVLHELTSWALERRIPLAGLEVRRPSLEDVYLELTAGEREGRAEE